MRELSKNDAVVVRDRHRHYDERRATVVRNVVEGVDATVCVMYRGFLEHIDIPWADVKSLSPGDTNQPTFQPIEVVCISSEEDNAPPSNTQAQRAPQSTPAPAADVHEIAHNGDAGAPAPLADRRPPLQNDAYMHNPAANEPASYQHVHRHHDGPGRDPPSSPPHSLHPPQQLHASHPPHFPNPPQGRYTSADDRHPPRQYNSYTDTHGNYDQNNAYDRREYPYRSRHNGNGYPRDPYRSSPPPAANRASAFEHSDNHFFRDRNPHASQHYSSHGPQSQRNSFPPSYKPTPRHPQDFISGLHGHVQDEPFPRRAPLSRPNSYPGHSPGGFKRGASPPLADGRPSYDNEAPRGNDVTRELPPLPRPRRYDSLFPTGLRTAPVSSTGLRTAPSSAAPSATLAQRPSSPPARTNAGSEPVRHGEKKNKTNNSNRRPARGCDARTTRKPERESMKVLRSLMQHPSPSTTERNREIARDVPLSKLPAHPKSSRPVSLTDVPVPRLNFRDRCDPGFEDGLRRQNSLPTRGDDATLSQRGLSSRRDRRRRANAARRDRSPPKYPDLVLDRLKRQRVGEKRMPRLGRTTEMEMEMEMEMDEAAAVLDVNGEPNVAPVADAYFRSNGDGVPMTDDHSSRDAVDLTGDIVDIVPNYIIRNPITSPFIPPGDEQMAAAVHAVDMDAETLEGMANLHIDRKQKTVVRFPIRRRTKRKAVLHRICPPPSDYETQEKPPGLGSQDTRRRTDNIKGDMRGRKDVRRPPRDSTPLFITADILGNDDGETDVFRLHECVCGRAEEPVVEVPGRQGSIQCSLCGQWLHLRCVQLSDDEITAFQSGSRRFQCWPCVEEAIPSVCGGTARVTDQCTGRGRDEDDVNADSDGCKGRTQEWGIQMRPVIPIRVQNNVGAVDWTETCLETRRRRRMVRSPLTERERDARAENLEMLWTGVIPASIGKKERALLDAGLLGVSTICSLPNEE